jgi:perosamine synthetase
LLARQSIYERYREALVGVSGIDHQPMASWALVAPWLFSITVNERQYGLTRDELATRLLLEGVDTRPFFYPLNRLPAYELSARRRGIPTPHADDLSASGLNLPTFNTLQPEEVLAIAEVIRRLGSG